MQKYLNTVNNHTKINLAKNRREAWSLKILNKKFITCTLLLTVVSITRKGNCFCIFNWFTFYYVLSMSYQPSFSHKMATQNLQ